MEDWKCTEKHAKNMRKTGENREKAVDRQTLT